jgi:hypothetical protein
MASLFSNHSTSTAYSVRRKDPAVDPKHREKKIDETMAML